MLAIPQSQTERDSTGPSVRADSSIEVDPRWAWAEYQPDEKRPWNAVRAGHLLRRATFGASWDELEQAVAAGPRRTIDQLVHSPADLAQFEQTMSQDEEAVARASGIDSLRAWWLRRMIRSPHPLQEKMTLFWHSHFGVSNSRVNDSQLMLQHVQMLRLHALGSYRALLEAAAQDPAVLMSVGAERSPKSQPNEQFIRQLMEQYSVGPGHYGDEDVREAARAFTGWAVLRGQLRFLAHEHDAGPKKVLGKQGDWEAQDIVRIVLEQPTTPRLLARKLYRYLVSEADEPSDTLLEPLADMLAQQYDVGVVVETILRSNQFFSAAAYRRRVKSPVEFALGLVLAVAGDAPTQSMGNALAALGQNLYSPPTTGGWSGGPRWINPVTMIARQKLARAMLAEKGASDGALDPAEAARAKGCSTAREAAEWLLRLYVQDDLPEAVRTALLASVPDAALASSQDRVRAFAVEVVMLPEGQLS